MHDYSASCTERKKKVLLLTSVRESSSRLDTAYAANEAPPTQFGLELSGSGMAATAAFRDGNDFNISFRGNVSEIIMDECGRHLFARATATRAGQGAITNHSRSN